MNTPIHLTGAQTQELYACLANLTASTAYTLLPGLSYRLVKFRDALKAHAERMTALQQEAILGFGVGLEEALEVLKSEAADLPPEEFKASEEKLRNMLAAPDARIVLPKDIPAYRAKLAEPLEDPEFAVLHLSKIPLSMFDGAQLPVQFISALAPILTDGETSA